MSSGVEIFRGDTWKRTWTITSGDVPVDFTGASAKLQVRKTREPNDIEIILEATIGNGLSFEGDGVIKLFVQTESLLSGKYYFDLEVTFPDGVIKTYEQNTLNLKQDISRN